MTPLSVLLLAGGQARRLWPVTASKPKFLVRLDNRKTLLDPYRGLLPHLTSPDRIFVITTLGQARFLRKALPFIPSRNFLIEPVGRDTGLATVTGAVAAQTRLAGPHFQLVLPVDHVIQKPERLIHAVHGLVRKAQPPAQDFLKLQSFLYVFGTSVLFPSELYGYIQVGKPLTRNPTSSCNSSLNRLALFQVRRFVEKPSYLQARKMKSPAFLWNCGIFLWHTRTFIDAVKRCTPELALASRRLQSYAEKGQLLQGMKKVYSTAKRVAIEKGLLERLPSQMAVLRIDLGWRDAGSWEALYELSHKDLDGNALRGNVRVFDTHRSFLYTSSLKEVLISSVQDLVVVEEGGRLLICPRHAVGTIKQLLSAPSWQARGRGHA